MAHCEAHPEPIFEGTAKIALIGNPNVGKSMLFHKLTGRYVIVSNYPGTTVEVTQGVLRGMENVTLIDTPGIIAFPPRGEDEAVTERVLLQNHLKTVLQVGDAKNLRRTLHLTVQLAEMGVPLVLALNMMDEAHALGLSLNTEVIEKACEIPVVRTVATRGRGVVELIQAVNRAEKSPLFIRYPELLEVKISEVERLLPAAPISKRSLALLWLSHDAVSARWIAERVPASDLDQLIQIRSELNAENNTYAAEIIQQTREDFIENIALQALVQTHPGSRNLGYKLGHLATHPVWGLPILVAVLAVMYWFVGIFGAGTLVGLLEEDLFGGLINPWLISHAERLVPSVFFLDLVFGEYGIWTMGVTYAMALLLPIVFTFFILFGVLEDSGYLPRLAVLTNRLFSWMGLNGQAILPMILGLGCVTMATMTTRILSRPRDRLMVTLLLALAIPCSAQLGVVMGMLAGISLSATLIWTGLVIGVMILVGWLAARLIKGERTPLVVELPPLRFPILSNVFIKTIARLEWYIKEAVPLFILGTVLLFAMDKLLVLPWLIDSLEPIVTRWLGLPASAATAFLLGLMRRDFAATGLFVMQSQGELSSLQALVAISTITLFIPCIASIFMIVKERGVKIALRMIAFIFPFAILVGGILYRLLLFLGWNG